MKQFYIHESNIDRLRKKFNRVRNKCQKYGCDFHYEEVGSEVREIEKDGKLIPAKYIIVEAEGQARINGWEFIASIEHTDAGNIVKTTSDIRVPAKYFKCGPECEHCNSKRHRKDTYLVYNVDTEEFKQVGSGCLFDYTGGLSAEYAANYISMFDELIQGEAPLPGCDFKTYYTVQEVLETGYEFVKIQGYISSDSWGLTTKDETKMALRVKYGTADRYDKDMMQKWESKHGWDLSRNTEYVKDAIAWVIEHEGDNSAYFNNIKVICKLGYVDNASLGYAVSILPVYYRALKEAEKEAQRQLKHAKELESSYVGEVGDKVEVVEPTIECIASWDTEWGTTYRYKFYNSANIYMWDSSSGIWIDKPIKSIKGTVKKHDTYDGVKQTWLTRCRVTYAECENVEVQVTNTAEQAISEFLEAVE